MKLKSDLTEWRPPIGTRIRILQHKDWAGHEATVTLHKKWMSRKLMNAAVENTDAIAGISDPDQFEVIDMTQVEFGSPEAQSILEKDRRREKNKDRIEWLKSEIRTEMGYISDLEDEFEAARTELREAKNKLILHKKELKDLVT